MKRSTKHAVASTILDFSDFSGGLNLRTQPENIAQNELSECTNMTYASQPGRLRTRNGIGAALHTYDADVDGMCWYGSALIVAAGGVLYKYVPASGDSAAVASTIGNLTGSVRPVWVEFGTTLYIASGGKIQSFDGTTLSTISDSPAAMVGLYARAGRLYGFEAGSDSLRGSAVGDPTAWTVPASATDSDPVELQIGYKVAGSIYCAVPSLTDVVFFKSGAAFRLTGEYPDWSIKEISRDEAIANGQSAVAVAGYLFYMEQSKGVRLLQGTSGYEEIIPADTLIKVNPYIRANMDVDKCRLWNLKARNILLVGLGGQTVLPAYYEYGLSDMPALMWTFPDDVRDIVEPDRERLFIAVGASIYDFSGSSAYDPDENVDSGLSLVASLFVTKKTVGFTQYLLKRVTVNAQLYKNEINNVPLKVYAGNLHLMDISFYFDDSPLVYGDDDPVYGNDDLLLSVTREYVDFSKHNTCRVKEVQMRFVNTGLPFTLHRFAVEVVPVGVVS